MPQYSNIKLNDLSANEHKIFWRVVVYGRTGKVSFCTVYQIKIFRPVNVWFELSVSRCWRHTVLSRHIFHHIYSRTFVVKISIFSDPCVVFAVFRFNISPHSSSHFSNTRLRLTEILKELSCGTFVTINAVIFRFTF